ncbi:prolyl-tRNA synthetase associated domain-containing protein [Inconstantimicrobium mannanitabidum]|uniref:Aminoacyl-tRNA deacylase n=1 Tax=Inconstantimicrobium mannanitabidum TaxID=1604901 RepID=A0ACB5RC54_9CLOT|nr:prolyl-tRNA synthetase associated domain-containing protein [Clostridium sp. TW13]GKX66459.1 aminoacyl-tRNA deacylase [Clostridium sp. TW13]
MIEKNEQQVYEVLNSLGINYVRYEHKPIYTVNEAKEIETFIEGIKCKNLFLRNVKGDTHYIIILDEDKRIDLKLLAKQIGSSRLSFASEERLSRYLKLKPGSVTPFGIINDVASEVIILIDRSLVNERLMNFHPNVNTATIGISYADLEKFIKWHKNRFIHIEIN